MRRVTAPHAWLIFMSLIAGFGALALYAVVQSLRSGPPPTLPHPVAAYGLGVPIPVVLASAGGAKVLAVLWSMIALLAIGSWQFARTLAAGKGVVTTIIAAQLIIGAVLSLTPVLLSSDIYAYVIYGRLFGIWGINPYHIVAKISPSLDGTLVAPLQLYGNPPYPDPYGPLWTLVASAVARAEMHLSLVFNLWTQRALALIAASFATAGIVRLAQSSAKGGGMRAATLFATHPLVIFETAVGGHNDMMMVALTVWAFAVVDTSPLLAGALLGASIGVKYVSIVALPFLFLKLLRRNWRAAVASTSLAIIIFAASALPFLTGATPASLVKTPHFIGISPMGLVYIVVTALGGSAVDGPTVSKLLGPIFTALFLAVYAAALFLYWSVRRHAAFWFGLTAFIWSLRMIFPWYGLWLAPAIVDASRWAPFAWWFGLLLFLRYAHEVPAGTSVAAAGVIAVIILFVPIYLAQRSPRVGFGAGSTSG